MWLYKKERILQRRRGLDSRRCRQPERSSLGVWEVLPIFSVHLNLQGSARATFLGFFHFLRICAGTFKIFSATWPGQEPAAHGERILCFSLEPWLPDRKHWVYLLCIYLQAVPGPNYCSKKIDHQSLETFKCRHCK